MRKQSLVNVYNMWLGIYNKSTRKITFSNAGHTLPLIKENGTFRYMDINRGIVLGILEDFEHINKFESDEDPHMALLNDIPAFTDGADQFDDMTLLYLKGKS